MGTTSIDLGDVDDTTNYTAVWNGEAWKVMEENSELSQVLAQTQRGNPANKEWSALKAQSGTGALASAGQALILNA